MQKVNLSTFEEFCGGPFFNLSTLWYNEWPQFTSCFMSTVLAWLPCGYVWLLLPYFTCDVNNKLSTNNLDLLFTSESHPTATANGGQSNVSHKKLSAPVSVLCMVKMIFTALMAVLSLIHFVIDVRNERPGSMILASAIFTATYALIAIELRYERHKNRNPTFVSFYFYTLNSFFGIIPIYTWILAEDGHQSVLEFSLVVLVEVLNVLCFVLSFLPDSVLKTYQKVIAKQKLCPEVQASYPSQLFFHWMLGLMITGFKREIKIDDVFDLNPRDQGRRLNPLFNIYWDKEVKKAEAFNKSYFPEKLRRTRYDLASGEGMSQRRLPLVSYDGTNEKTTLLFAEESKIGTELPSREKKLKIPSLTKVLLQMIWKNIVAAMLQKVVADITLFASPVLLGLLIEQLQSPIKEFIWKAYVISLGMFICGVIKSILFAQAMQRSILIGLHAKTILISAIYKKALTISNSAKKGSTVGEIVNLMSVDCQRIQEILTMFFFMWTTPLQILLSVILLYLTIGPSVLVGVGLLILLVPVNTWIGSKQKLIQESMLAIKDSRIKLVNEILNGMKVLKLYAWETQFKNKVEAIRNKEVVQLYKIALLYVLSGLCWGVAPYVVGMLTFATYVLSDRTNVLDPQKAFVSLALFNLLRVPLNYVSTIIIYTVQIFVSIKRINKFLTRPDLDETNTTWDPNALNAVVIRSGRFTWDRDYGITLKNIDLTITPGQLTAIVGPVGAGKSSLIFAILGEMEKLKGEVIVKGSPAYVSQQAWIQNATVRDNILFGKKYNKRRYDLVVKACELERDFQILEAGDQTEIGEKGINLSGGQKQRINLARAVYSDSDLYLFDDPLSAVDAHVGKAIFKNVMSQKGLLAKKTRVLVTHGVHWLPQVNKIVVMSKGTISEQGTYEQLLSHNGAFAQFLEMYLADTKCPDESDNDIELNGVKKAMKSVVDRITSDKSGDEMNYFTDEDRPNKRINRQRSSTSISQPIHIHESIDLSSTLAGIEKSVHPVGGKLILEEKLETGKVKREVYIDYGRAAGLWAMAGAFLAYAANQGFFVWSSFFLTDWTQDALLLNESTRITQEGKERTDYYILVYSLFFGSTQVIAFYVFNYLFWYRLVRAADRLHHLLLDRLFHAPMSFFDQTPMGRILNRFSKDVDTVDNTLPLILRDFLMTFSIIAITIIVILIETPLFAAVLVPLVILFLLIQNYYVQTSRQLKRMESISRSPIYAYFSETISGAPVIRAYRAMERFKAESERRVDKNQVFYFTSWSAIRWNQLNMDTLANLVVLFSAILQIVAGGEGSGAGLSVSYALQVAGALPYMVRQISEFETNIVSVERMKEYFQVEQEAALINPKNRPSPEWPSKGNVTFVNYQTRYRPGLDLVLKGVNCQIIGGEKIGIVGRTGAGKSSLTLCLFRIIEAVSGSIFVDEVNIAGIGLHDLRSKLTILPQDPVLFSGSLRMNVDPFEQYSDDQMWTALARSHLKDFVSSQPEGLLYECGEEGSNLSIGQRQLVCLARSLLRKTKILILDEATAAIDMETDALIQTTIRDAFKDCTIIAIAHRLNTIMDYDRVIVLDAGVIKEFASPRDLIEAGGIFYSMCRDSGLV